MTLSVSEKIKIILKRKGLTLANLADLTNQSRQNLSNKINRNNFSEKEIAEIAKVLNVEYECKFTLEDGTTI